MKTTDELLKKIASDEKFRVSLSEAAKSGTADSFLKSQGIGAQELTDDEAAAATGGAVFLCAPQNPLLPFPCRNPKSCTGMAEYVWTNPYDANEHYYLCDTCYATHVVNVHEGGGYDITVNPLA